MSTKNTFYPFYLLFLMFFICPIAFSQYKSDFRVNDDAGNDKSQNSSRISVDSEGNFVVVWQDARNMHTLNPIFDIYFQRYNFKGEPQGANYKVNYNDTAAVSPDVAMRKDGSFVITWYEGAYINNQVDSGHLYLRIFDKNGNPISERIRIDDTTHWRASDDKIAVSIFDNNDIICAFVAFPNSVSNRDVFIQKFTSTGQRIGANRLVNDDTISFHEQRHPDITVRTDNSFIVSFDNFSQNGGFANIYIQIYNSAGEKVGNNIKVNDDNLNLNHDFSRISSDTTGRFALVWNDTRETQGSFFDIFCQFYNSDGTPSGSNFRVPFGFYEWQRFLPSLCFRKDGNLVIGWGDEYANGAGECPFFLRFSPQNQIIGYQHAATYYYPAQMKIYNDIALCGDRIITTWVDYRNGHSDIYASIMSFQNPDSVVNGIINPNISLPENTLSQNYPNPFNPITKIEYSLPKNSFVTIKIYDIMGREITTLVNETKPSGRYSIEFNGSKLASGIYFYRMQAGYFNSVKKMILIK